MLLRLLKKSDEFARLPVAIYSSHLTPELERALIADGAVRCYRKAQNQAEALALAKSLLALGAFTPST